jgi:hypothetical protein
VCGELLIFDTSQQFARHTFQGLEDGLYDSNDRLRENRLIERVREDPRWTFQEGNRAIESLGLSPLELPIPKERNITCVPPRFFSDELKAG